MKVRLKGHCPVLPVSQALTLISELEAVRLKRFENAIEDLKKQVQMIRDQARDSWSWQQRLRALCEDGGRTSMASFLHVALRLRVWTLRSCWVSQKLFPVIQRMVGTC